MKRHSDNFRESAIQEIIRILKAESIDVIIYEPALEESLFNFDVKVTEDDNLITLVTCTRMFGQQYDKAFKIDGRMIRSGEKAVNYNVNEKASYKKIKEIMKGDNENETDV